MRARRTAAAFALAAAIPVLVAGCRGSGSAESSAASARASTATAPASVAEATFDVPGMTCASCNMTVKMAAERVAGVREARADFRTKRAFVTYEPTRTTPAAIAAAITEAGYPATPVAPSAGP